GAASIIAASLVATPANEALNIVNELQRVLGAGQVATFSDNDEIPKAYLQYLSFDNNYKFKKSGFRQVSNQGEGAFETLTLEHVAEEDGFMMMYVANETNEDLNVFFDDLTVVHSEGPVIRKDDYYPFGLSYNTSTLGGALTNKYLYNGKELIEDLNLNFYDYGARMYDPAIGRWSVVDPLAEQMRRHSPYNYAFNNPIRFIDPNGMAPKNCCPPSSGSVFYSEVEKNFGFIKSGIENLFGGSKNTGSRSKVNSQPAGVVLVVADAGPDDIGTIGDKISGEVNTDGLGSFGSGLPSGGVMEKIADMMGSVFGLVSEFFGSDSSKPTENTNSSETVNPTSETEPNSRNGSQGTANPDGKKNTNADTVRGTFVDRQGNIGKYRIILQGKDTLDQKYYVPDGY
ncbi:RHS repeat domain-containing protein, partial [Aquiflexum sp.]|uniref:RHS repeat domain-containing protein n=1 Tax=Aquiflexum sp. TaxID=1872584 RepID=UPI0035934245